MNPALLIFDMDGVLVDVTRSYREAILATVEQFTGRRLTHEIIQLRKNGGGFNNDWDLSHALIREQGGREPARMPSYDEVVKAFQQLYLGKDHDGLLMNETWMPSPGVLERLAVRHPFALFTGRLREEAQFALRRFAPGLTFDPIVGMEDVARQKPDPEGLEKIRSRVNQEEMIYVGDSIDDGRAASAAGMRFIGVAASGLPHREELAASFTKGGAAAVIPHVNSLEEVL